MKLFMKAAHKVEKLWDKVSWKNSTDNPMIDRYTGYSTPTGVVIRGRVLSKELKKTVTKAKPSIFNNIKAMVQNFATDEMADVLVESGSFQTRTDEEGYFTLEINANQVVNGMVLVRLPDLSVSADVPVVMTSKDAAFGVISDIDDTIMHTGAWQLHRNIWTTLTGSVVSRRIFKDTADLLRHLHNGKNPVFYVSSSPWNLHQFLTDVFEHNNVVFGPKFLRDLGISDTQFIKSSHGSHKGDAIDTIMQANPTLRFVLIGDTGQHDAHVYRDAIVRHGDRIKAVYLRHAGPVNVADEEAVALIKATGTPMYVRENFSGLF